MFDYGKYTPYVLTSYGIAAVVLTGLIIWSVMRLSNARRKLAEAEKDDPRRGDDAIIDAVDALRGAGEQAPEIGRRSAAGIAEAVNRRHHGGHYGLQDDAERHRATRPFGDAGEDALAHLC